MSNPNNNDSDKSIINTNDNRSNNTEGNIDVNHDNNIEDETHQSDDIKHDSSLDSGNSDGTHNFNDDKSDTKYPDTDSTILKIDLKSDTKSSAKLSISDLLKSNKPASQFNKNSKTGIAFFVGIVIIYLTILMGAFSGTIFLIIVPFLLLSFIEHTGKNPVPYVALSAIIAIGALMSSFYVALFFLLATIVPTLILYYTHKVEVDVTESVMSYTKDIVNKSAAGGKTQLRITLFPFGKVNFLPILLAPLPLAAIMALFIALSPDFVAAFSELFIKQLETLYEPALSSDLTRLDSNNPISILYQNRHELVVALISISPAALYAYVGLVIFFTQKFYYKMPYSYITHLPDALLAVVVAAGLMIVVPIVTGATATSVAGYNLLIATSFIFFCRGFDIVQYNLNKWQVTSRSAFFGVFKYMMYFLMVTSRNFMIGTAVVGFISLYRNLTKKIEVKTDDK